MGDVDLSSLSGRGRHIPVGSPSEIAHKAISALASPDIRVQCLRGVDIPTSAESLHEATDARFGPSAVWIGTYASAAPLISRLGLRRWLASLTAQAAIILYRWQETYGHWFCVFLQSSGDIQ